MCKRSAIFTKITRTSSESVSNSLYKAEGGLLEYNSGGTHEQNPNGGIPVGPKGYPSNKPVAMVEEGETCTKPAAAYTLFAGIETPEFK